MPPRIIRRIFLPLWFRNLNPANTNEREVRDVTETEFKEILEKQVRLLSEASEKNKDNPSALVALTGALQQFITVASLQLFGNE